MAYDVDAAESVGGYEAIVEVIRLPAYSGRDGVLVLECGVPALVGDTVGDDFIDVPVGKGKRRERDGGDKGLHYE